MQLNLNISQIFLPKRKESKGYVSVYEETVRTDNPVMLFVAIEVGAGGKTSLAGKTQEFEKLTQALAGSLKRTYISEARVNDYTFEKALNNLNQELSNLAHRGVVGWYKKLNAVVGAYERGTLHITVAGTGSAMLLRDGEFTEISESLSSGEKPHPLKTFVNFASGSISDRDVILLGGNGIYNYLSLEKIRTTFSELSLAEATKELIGILEKDTPADQPFATFIVKATTRAEMADEDLAPLMTPASHTIIEERETSRMTSLRGVSNSAQKLFATLGRGIFAFGKTIFSGLQTSQKQRQAAREDAPLPTLKPKKNRRGLLLAVVIVGILLALSLLFFNFRNSQQKSRQGVENIISQAMSSANEAEAALIYNDETTALQKMQESQSLIASVAGSEYINQEYDNVLEKLEDLATRLNKEQPITTVETVGRFEHGPTKLIKTEAGFVALNTFIDSIETLDLSNSAVTTLTTSAAESLVDGSLMENFSEPIMLSESGDLFTLGLLEGNLTPVSATSTYENPNLAAVEFYGSRAYVLDRASSQIFRYNQANNAFEQPSPWLNSGANFSEASDITIDGDIYVLLPNNILKFTSGNSASFSLTEFSPEMVQATQIITNVDFQFIYVLEPSQQRIIILTKQGSLAVQLTGPNFSDLKDFWVDETSKTMYVLNGNELIRFGY